MKITDRPAEIRRRSLIVALVVALQSLWVPATHSAQAQNNSRTFPETGQTVSGLFLNYWDTHGGLAQQGYPISDEMQETSDTDGKTYKVQYFERAVFEAHPENKAPYDVLLSLLGDSFYKQKYPGGAPGQTADSSPGTILFNETGKHLGTFPSLAVLTPEVLYGYEKGVLRAFDLAAMPDPSPPKRPAAGLLILTGLLRKLGTRLRQTSDAVQTLVRAL